MKSLLFLGVEKDTVHEVEGVAGVRKEAGRLFDSLMDQVGVLFPALLAEKHGSLLLASIYPFMNGGGEDVLHKLLVILEVGLKGPVEGEARFFVLADHSFLELMQPLPLAELHLQELVLEAVRNGGGSLLLQELLVPLVFLAELGVKGEGILKRKLLNLLMHGPIDTGAHLTLREDGLHRRIVLGLLFLLGAISAHDDGLRLLNALLALALGAKGSRSEAKAFVVCGPGLVVAVVACASVRVLHRKI